MKKTQIHLHIIHPLIISCQNVFITPLKDAISRICVRHDECAGIDRALDQQPIGVSRQNKILTLVFNKMVNQHFIRHLYPFSALIC